MKAVNSLATQKRELSPPERFTDHTISYAVRLKDINTPEYLSFKPETHV